MHLKVIGKIFHENHESKKHGRRRINSVFRHLTRPIVLGSSSRAIDITLSLARAYAYIWPRKDGLVQNKHQLAAGFSISKLMVHNMILV